MIHGVLFPCSSLVTWTCALHFIVLLKVKEDLPSRKRWHSLVGILCFKFDITVKVPPATYREKTIRRLDQVHLCLSLQVIRVSISDYYTFLNSAKLKKKKYGSTPMSLMDSWNQFLSIVYRCPVRSIVAGGGTHIDTYTLAAKSSLNLAWVSLSYIIDNIFVLITHTYRTL